MANATHLRILKRGVEAWNEWKEDHPRITADFEGAKLSGVNLAGAELCGANLCQADLREADLSGANLESASFSEAILINANLRRAIAFSADFCTADLTNANLSGAELGLARLIDARLDGATLTAAGMWDTVRTVWSIKGVICELCFWSRNSRKEPTIYAPGEFERAFAEKPRIVLEYPEGIRPFDFAMLPLVVEQLQAEHPNTALHVRSVQDEGGKATVTLVVDDLANRDPEEFLREVADLREQLTSTQMLLLKIEVERDVYQEEYRALIKEMTMKASKQITIGTVTGGHIGDISHSHDIQSGQTNIYQPNDLDQIRKLIGEIHEQREAVRGAVTESQFAELQASLDTVRVQLAASQPDQSLVKGALGTIRRIVEGAAANVVGGGWLQALQSLG